MININEVMGHYVEAEISFISWSGKSKHTLEGRIIYSDHNASLFFKPKNSKNKGYFIEDENDIHSVKIIRKDNRNNEYYIAAYNNREKSEQKLNKRLEKEEEERKEQDRLRKERFEMERRKEQEDKEKEINDAKNLGGYDTLENDVVNFYQSFKDEFFNEEFVKSTYIPILNKLVHKSIDNVDGYSKHFFSKERNPKFCALIENKLNIKLPKTQKGSIEVLNKYLSA
jgi:hypothetical protein